MDDDIHALEPRVTMDDNIRMLLKPEESESNDDQKMLRKLSFRGIHIKVPNSTIFLNLTAYLFFLA